MSVFVPILGSPTGQSETFTARYWRVRIPTYVNYPSIGELQFAMLGQAMPAISAYIESSHHAELSDASGAFDGSYITAWYPASAIADTWVGADFGSDIEVNCIRLQGRVTGSQYPTSVVVEYSGDGSNWTEAWTITGLGVSMLENMKPYPSPSVSVEDGYYLWRFLWIDDNGSGSVAVSEVEMRDSIGGSDLLVNSSLLAKIAINGVNGQVTEQSATEIVDGSTSNYTAWGLPGWWQYEFDQPRNIVEVAVSARLFQSGQAPSEFKLQYSIDGIAWFDSLHVGGQNSWVSFPAETRVFNTSTVFPLLDFSDENNSMYLPPVIA